MVAQWGKIKKKKLGLELETFQAQQWGYSICSIGLAADYTREALAIHFSGEHLSVHYALEALAAT